MVEKRKRQLVQSLGINSLLLVKVSNWVIATQPQIMWGLNPASYSEHFASLTLSPTSRGCFHCANQVSQIVIVLDLM